MARTTEAGLGNTLATTDAPPRLGTLWVSEGAYGYDATNQRKLRPNGWRGSFFSECQESEDRTNVWRRVLASSLGRRLSAEDALRLDVNALVHDVMQLVVARRRLTVVEVGGEDLADRRTDVGKYGDGMAPVL